MFGVEVDKLAAVSVGDGPGLATGAERCIDDFAVALRRGYKVAAEGFLYVAIVVEELLEA